MCFLGSSLELLSPPLCSVSLPALRHPSPLTVEPSGTGQSCPSIALCSSRGPPCSEQRDPSVVTQVLVAQPFAAWWQQAQGLWWPWALRSLCRSTH